MSSLYLVTGGAGFIGSHITSALVERGDRVRVLDNLETGRRENLAHLEVGEPGSGAPVELVLGSITEPGDCERAATGVTGVFHEAAQVSVPQSIELPEHSYEVNVMGTLRVLEAARKAGCRRVVFAASSAAYGESEELPKVETMTPAPCSPYASGKVAAEHLLRVWGHVHGMHTTCLRYFNIFGPRQADDSPYTGVIAIFVRRLLDGLPVTIHGDGGQTRDFTFVGNAVKANLLALEATLEPGAIVNVGAGEQLSVADLYKAIAEDLGVSAPAELAPARAGDVRHSLASLERARDWLGYEPETSWREGLTRTVAWYRERFGS